MTDQNQQQNQQQNPQTQWVQQDQNTNDNFDMFGWNDDIFENPNLVKIEDEWVASDNAVDDFDDDIGVDYRDDRSLNNPETDNIDPVADITYNDPQPINIDDSDLDNNTSGNNFSVYDEPDNPDEYVSPDDDIQDLDDIATQENDFDPISEINTQWDENVSNSNNWDIPDNEVVENLDDTENLDDIPDLDELSETQNTTQDTVWGDEYNNLDDDTDVSANNFDDDSDYDMDDITPDDELFGYDDSDGIINNEKINNEEWTMNNDEYSDKPIDDIEEPVDDIEEPIEDVEEPVDDVEEPVDDVEEPVDDVEEPVDDVEEPMDDVEEPIDDVEEPVDDVEEPMDDIEEPVDDVEEPVEDIEEPMDDVEEPVEEIEEPIEEDKPESFENDESKSYVQNKFLELKFEWEKIFQLVKKDYSVWFDLLWANDDRQKIIYKLFIDGNDIEIRKTITDKTKDNETTTHTLEFNLDWDSLDILIDGELLYNEDKDLKNDENKNKQVVEKLNKFIFLITQEYKKISKDRKNKELENAKKAAFREF